MTETCLAPVSVASLLHYAARAPAGAFAEIGVWKGGSAVHLAALARAHNRGPVWLFDTFAGMPRACALDEANPVGKFADTSAEAVQALIPDAQLVVGDFIETFEGALHPPLAFVHADADNYEVTKFILQNVPQRMVRGGMILFDDFMQPGCDGCTQAVLESPFRVLVLTENGRALVMP